ncbi:hypothetical protein AAC691_15540 [Nguyenibacter vanlangensis]|uniref:Uncharacterized protein n=1 Tax=Nguyenibacter vanlangensis TaxID=1216886 RepID=A0ABZ3D1Q5_9PROT
MKPCVVLKPFWLDGKRLEVGDAIELPAPEYRLQLHNKRVGPPGTPVPKRRRRV